MIYDIQAQFLLGQLYILVHFTFILIRVETQDGGDAKVEVSPRDIVYMENAEPINGEQPEILHKLDLRYAYVLQTIHQFTLVGPLSFSSLPLLQYSTRNLK